MTTFTTKEKTLLLYLVFCELEREGKADEECRQILPKLVNLEITEEIIEEKTLQSEDQPV